MAAPFISENQCVWTRVRWRNLQQDANSGTTGFDEDAVGISGGGQFALSGPWYAGVAFGYENSQIDTNTPVINSDGDRFRVGGSLKYISGPWFVGGAVTWRLEQLRLHPTNFLPGLRHLCHVISGLPERGRSDAGGLPNGDREAPGT